MTTTTRKKGRGPGKREMRRRYERLVRMTDEYGADVDVLDTEDERGFVLVSGEDTENEHCFDAGPFRSALAAERYFERHEHRLRLELANRTYRQEGCADCNDVAVVRRDADPAALPLCEMCATARRKKANAERYRELMTEMEEYKGDLDVVDASDARGPRFLVVGYRPDDTDHEDEYYIDDNRFTTEAAARRHLETNEETLRVELASTFYTQAECGGCGTAVPVQGQYVPYAPAGVVMCGDCLDPDGFSGPAIVRE